MDRLEKCISITEAALDSLRITIELVGELLRELPDSPGRQKLAVRWKQLSVEFADVALSADEVAINSDYGPAD